MKKLLIFSLCAIFVSSVTMAKNSKNNSLMVRDRGGMLIKIGNDVLGIGTEGVVVGIDTIKKVVDVKTVSSDYSVSVDKIPAQELQVLNTANIIYVDVGGIEKIHKNTHVLSFLGESKVIKIYQNNLIRIKSLNGPQISEKVVNADDVEVLIPTKRGVKGWNKEFTIRKGDLVAYDGDAEVLMTYKYSKAKIRDLSSGEIKIVSSTDLNINKNLDKVNVSRKLGSKSNTKESIEELF